VPVLVGDLGRQQQLNVVLGTSGVNVLGERRSWITPTAPVIESPLLLDRLSSVAAWKSVSNVRVNLIRGCL
jgi:hypothetical protein